MRVPVHSPWLPGYIDVAQTVLIILPMAAHFPDHLVYVKVAKRVNLKVLITRKKIFVTMCGDEC